MSWNVNVCNLTMILYTANLKFWEEKWSEMQNKKKFQGTLFKYICKEKTRDFLAKDFPVHAEKINQKCLFFSSWKII